MVIIDILNTNLQFFMRHDTLEKKRYVQNLKIVSSSNMTDP